MQWAPPACLKSKPVAPQKRAGAELGLEAAAPHCLQCDHRAEACPVIDADRATGLVGRSERWSVLQKDQTLVCLNSCAATCGARCTQWRPAPSRVTWIDGVVTILVYPNEGGSFESAVLTFLFISAVDGCVCVCSIGRHGAQCRHGIGQCHARPSEHKLPDLLIS